MAEQVPPTPIARVRRGRVTHRQTIRKRPSKAPSKRRKAFKHWGERLPRPAERAALAEVDDGLA